ncbi:MAG: hypothetical protein AAB305_03000 [Candidatus Zixiibacteriota bacterium]
MSTSSVRRFYPILILLLSLMTVVIGGVVTVQADSMTGDPPAETPSGTVSGTSAETSYTDLLDVALLLLLIV